MSTILAKQIASPVVKALNPEDQQKATIQKLAVGIQTLLYQAVKGGNRAAHDALRLMGRELEDPEMVKLLALGLAGFQMGERRMDLSDIAATPQKVSEKLTLLLKESEARSDALEAQTRSKKKAVSSFESPPIDFRLLDGA